ncbi:MAG: lasso peptide biosynthesis B2 protein [Pseudomonadota bacterium]
MTDAVGDDLGAAEGDPASGTDTGQPASRAGETKGKIEGKLRREAAWGLLRARALTLLPAKIYTKALGRLGRDEPAACSDADRLLTRAIGEAVAAAAARSPVRAACLEQVIATRRMLRRRGLSGTISLGIAREGDLAAHAWLTAGGEVISGQAPLDDFAVIGRFG